MDPEVRAQSPGLCSKCGMNLVPGIPEILEYPLRLKVDPPHVPANSKIRLSFRVNDPTTGAPVRNFQTVHEKLFHLFLVSQDLEHFAHEHPALGTDGVFRLETVLPEPGVYRLLADFYPAHGTPQLITKTLITAGYTKDLESETRQIPTDLAPKRSENMTVELRIEPERPIAGKKTLLFFRLNPAQGIEPYLGAWGHMLAAGNDLTDLIHSHPSIANGGAEIQFDVFFPHEAIYRIWVQFQRNGKVNTASFTVPVSELR